MSRYQFEKSMGDYTRTEQAEFARRRADIVEALLDDGYVPGYGFGRRVADACELEEIPHNRHTISRDIMRVKRKLFEDGGTTGYGRDYILSLLGDELSGLMKVDMEGASADDMIKMARARSNLLEKIANIEGVKKPTKKVYEVRHVHEIIAKLPTDVFKRFEAAKDLAEAERILVHEIGEADARILLAAISSASIEE